MLKRKPDFVIGDPDEPYLRRWWLIPRNRFFNIYLHEILRSDDDRALHDHPWWNVSIILKGGYVEHVPGGRHSRTRGDIVFRRAKTAHRLELGVRLHVTDQPEADGVRYEFGDVPCWSLFITGPRVRQWGFHCASGWKHWREFCGVPEGEESKGDERGPGCD